MPGASQRLKTILEGGGRRRRLADTQATHKGGHKERKVLPGAAKAVTRVRVGEFPVGWAPQLVSLVQRAGHGRQARQAGTYQVQVDGLAVHVTVLARVGAHTARGVQLAKVRVRLLDHPTSRPPCKQHVQHAHVPPKGPPVERLGDAQRTVAVRRVCAVGPCHDEIPRRELDNVVERAAEVQPLLLRLSQVNG